MATTIVKYVKPNGGGDYTSLAAAEAAMQQNLVSNDLCIEFRCQGGVDTTPVTLSGYFTGQNNYIAILGEGFHPGAPTPSVPWNFSSNWYTLQVTNADALVIDERWVTVKGLQVEVIKTNTTSYKGINTATTSGEYIWIAACKVICTASNNLYRRGIGIDATSGASVFGCSVWGWIGTSTSYGIRGHIGTGGYGLHIINNTVDWCSVGILIWGTVGGFGKVYNNLTFNCWDGFRDDHTAGTLLAGNNCSDISGDALGANSRTGLPGFIDRFNGDIRLRGDDTVARNYGNNDMASLYGIDHINTARIDEGTADIGAFETHPHPIYPSDSTAVSSSDSPVIDYVPAPAPEDCVVAASSDFVVITQLHVLGGTWEDSVATGSDSPVINVSVQIEQVTDCDVGSSCDHVSELVHIQILVGAKCFVRPVSDQLKLWQHHILVVNDSTVQTTSEQPGANTQMNLSGVASCDVASSSDNISTPVEHNIIVQECWVFCLNTRIYAEGSSSNFTYVKHTEAPVYKESVLSTPVKIAYNITPTKDILSAVDVLNARG